MPFFEEQDPRVTIFREAFNYAQLDWEPSFSQVVGAAFKVDNTLFAFPSFTSAKEPVEGYDPLDHMQGLEQFASELIYARSPSEFEEIRRRIQDRQQARLILGQASTGKMLLAEFIAAGLDPVNLLFAGGAVMKGVSLGRNLQQNIVRGARLGLGAGLSTEGIFQLTQSDRPVSESALAIITGAALGGALMVPVVLGRHRLNLRQDRIRELKKTIQSEMANGPIYIEPTGIPRTGVPGERRYTHRGQDGITFPDLPEGYQIKIGKNKVREGKRYVPASHNRKSKTITLDEDYIKGPMFRGKEWTKPKVKGVLPLPEDMFKTPEEWFNFVKMHEIMHVLNRRLKNEILADYENRINKLALFMVEKGGRAKRIDPHSGKPVLYRYQDRVRDLEEAIQRGERGARARRETRSDDTDTKPESIPGGVEFIAGATSPGLRTLNSTNHRARSIVEALVETGVFLQKNFRGVRTEQSVETLAKTWRAALVEQLSDVKKLHAAYRTRLRGQEPREPRVTDALRNLTEDAAIWMRGGATETLSLSAFRVEVTRALRAGGKHSIGEVAEAAKRIRKQLDHTADEAVRVGLLKPEDLDSNYVPRMWNQPKVQREYKELVERIYHWQRENLGTNAKSRAEIASQVDMILKTPDGIEGMEITGPKGIFKTRSIEVAEDVIEDFLENNIDTILRSYNRMASMDIEIARKFGTVDMAKAIQEMEYVAKTRIDKATTAEQKVAINAELVRNVADIKAMRDILRGIYGLPENPYSLSSRAARLALEFNNLTMLGGVVISSLPDMARIVMTNGMEATLPMLRTMISDWKTWKAAGKEVQLAGTALDMMLQTRALALVSMGELPMRFTAAERIMGYATNAFFMANLLSPWNSFIKRAAGISISHRIISDSIKLSKGTLGKKATAKLAAAGIDAPIARKIATQYAEHGEKVKGLFMPNTQEWKDLKTQRIFRAALVRDVDVTIVTPGAGDQPLFAHKMWGRILTQYKSFVFASATRVMVPGLQIRDAAALHGLMMMTFIGGFVTMLRDKQNKRPTADSPLAFIQDGLDQSGVTSWFFSANNAIEAISDNKLGFRPITGSESPYGSSTRWKVGSVLGPTAGQGMRLAELASDVVTGSVDFSTRRSAWRMFPGNNLFPLRMNNVFRMRKGFEAMEQTGTVDSMADIR